MENIKKYLLELRLIVYNNESLSVYYNLFHQEPERFMLKKDYALLFPKDDLSKVNEEKIDILQITNDVLKMQMLFLIQVNLSFIFLKHDLFTFSFLYEKLSLSKLLKKYNSEQILFYLYELFCAPGIVSFLLKQNINDLDLKQVFFFKEKQTCLDNFWEHITDCFVIACQVEQICLKENLIDDFIPLYLYTIVAIDELILINNLSFFINQHKTNLLKTKHFGYNAVRSLCQKEPVPLKEEKETTTIRKRLSTTSSSQLLVTNKKVKKIKKKTKVETPAPIITCEYCIAKQPCLECETSCNSVNFTACHESTGGGHFCKDARNILNKEKRRDGNVQPLTLKDGRILRGYRLNNMLFTCKGNLFDTRDVFCHCPNVPELNHETLSVSLQLYVYDNKQYRLGTLKTRMTILEGNDVFSDFAFQIDSSIFPMNPKLKEIHAFKNNIKTTYTFEEDKMLIINGVETKYKKSSVRVYKQWNSVTNKFFEDLPQDDKLSFCISYGILDDVCKHTYDSITLI